MLVATSQPSHDTHGIEIVGPDSLQSIPANEAQAAAFDKAYLFVLAHPNDAGYPFLDGKSNVLYFTAASPSGRALFEAEQGDKASTGPAISIRETSRSLAQLQAIRDDIVHWTMSLPRDATRALITATEPDELNNRIIITVSGDDASLLGEIAERYGTDAIAVRVSPGWLPQSTYGQRRNDTSPHYGGAWIKPPGINCSSAFSWGISVSVPDAMLTAGHCARNGGTVTMPNGSTLGTVKSGYEENWKDGDGTVPFTGQSALAGDLALIRLTSSQHASPRIYRGHSTSSSWDYVGAIWSRSPIKTDQYWVGGSYGGETGVYTVVATNKDEFYVNEWAWARNMTEGESYNGSCAVAGDSGGSVFTNRTDGSVAAKGVSSGSILWPWGTCSHWFTDIRLAAQYLPGALKIN